MFSRCEKLLSHMTTWSISVVHQYFCFKWMLWHRHLEIWNTRQNIKTVNRQSFCTYYFLYMVSPFHLNTNKMHWSFETFSFFIRFQQKDRKEKSLDSYYTPILLLVFQVYNWKYIKLNILTNYYLRLDEYLFYAFFSSSFSIFLVDVKNTPKSKDP